MAENEKKNSAAPQEENLSQLTKVRRDKLRELQESGNDPFKYEVNNDSANIKANFDALEGSEVSIAGRLMSKRGMALRPEG